MTQYIDGGEIRGYVPTNTSTEEGGADYVIRDDLERADLTRRASDYKGTGTFLVNNENDTWTTVVNPGDRLLFYINTVVEGGGYGQGGYGEGPYGSGRVLRWSGMARNLGIEETVYDNFSMTINAEQYAPCIMDIRSAYATFESQPIAGPNGICNELIEDNCPELSTSRLPDLSQTTTIFRRGQTVLRSMADLAVRANRLLVTDGRFVDLVEPEAIVPAFTVEQTEDIGVIATQVNDDNVVNDLRVEGGTGHDPESQAAQTIVNGYELVTQSDRLFYQINTRKSELERVELWTHPTGSGEDYIVRLQEDENGAPVAPADTKSDIASRRLDPAFVDNDGFTSFLFGDHTLPEPFPWMIVESGGPVGQEVGINTATGAPGVIPHFPYEIIIELTSPQSIDVYRRREDKISNDDIGTFAAARDKGNEVLAKRDEPTIQVEVTAYSERMHEVSPGDVVTFDEPEARAVGDFVVLEVRDIYSIGQLNTEITLKKLD